MAVRTARTRAAALIAAAIAVALCCARCACAPGRQRVMRRAVMEMMERDALYADVLAERVLARADGKGALPAWARAELLPRDAPDDNVDALAALHRLVPAGAEYQSGRDLALAAAVLGAAVRCVAYKRATVQVTLMAFSIRNGAADDDLRARVTVLAHVLPRTADALVALGAPHAELLDLFRRIVGHASEKKYARKELAAALEQSRLELVAAVVDSCAVSEIRQYTHDLGLTVAEQAFAGEAAGGATAEGQESAVQMMRVNENAMLDAHERMYMLRAADPAVWKTVFDVPDLPVDDPKRFERTPAVVYRDKVVTLMKQRAQKAVDARRAGEIAATAAANAAITDSVSVAVDLVDRAIPIVVI